VSSGQRDGSLWPYSLLSRPEIIIILITLKLMWQERAVAHPSNSGVESGRALLSPPHKVLLRTFENRVLKRLFGPKS
jgi:hypothetical protein